MSKIWLIWFSNSTLNHCDQIIESPNQSNSFYESFKLVFVNRINRFLEKIDSKEWFVHEFDLLDSQTHLLECYYCDQIIETVWEPNWSDLRNNNSDQFCELNQLISWKDQLRRFVYQLNVATSLINLRDVNNYFSFIRFLTQNEIES